MSRQFGGRLATWLGIAALVGLPPIVAAETPKLDTSRGDRMIAEYFGVETQRLRDACLTDVLDAADWNGKRDEYRRQLLEMLGVDPLPPQTDLQATVTGRVEHDEFLVERLHFQSQPGLYVTGNLYLPRDLPGRAPAVLYVCGHGASKKDGVSFGNKVTYQHHGAWFARHGYVCLIIDTLQMGEIESIHHGTYRYKMWWWLNRGYTPAGVEAWNCLRALDYLQTRPEVDPERLGVTGRSGGGAYSWWIAAIDERIKVAVPVAGITDLENHVVDGCVEGHCDCMYMVNTYRWDYPLVAALLAPRPLLLSNTDRDGIFPLDGVVRTYDKARKIYELYKAGDQLGLHLTAGPHRDTQELQTGAFLWFNRHLKDDATPIERPAVKFFEPEQLKVFEQLPQDQRNTEIHESFVPAAEPAPVPTDADAWRAQRDAWRSALLQKSFRAWPVETCPLDVAQAFAADRDGLRLEAWDFTSQTAIRLRLYLLYRSGLENAESVVFDVLDDPAWNEFLAMLRPAFAAELAGESLPPADEAAFGVVAKTLRNSPQVLAAVAPRGVGPTAWDQSEKKQTQHQRRFYLLGQTVDGMRVWDVRRAIQALRCLEFVGGRPLSLHSQRAAAGVALYAALFEPNIRRLHLLDLPRTHRDGPYLLNVQRYLDMPQAVAMAAEHSDVVLHQPDPAGWEYPQAVVKQLQWDAQRLQIERQN
jgi:cephalosporin-C deacetylase-like acetyl esterase